MSDETRRRLEGAGRRPVPAMDPEAAARLEARLLAIAAESPAGSSPGAASRPGGAGRRLVLAGTAVAALLLAVALGLGVPRPVAAPELAAPVNVEVALADGTTLEDPDGLRLPEGAVVTVGFGGSARIGDLQLVEGDVATIRGGRVLVEHRPPVGSVPDPAPGAETADPSPTRAPRETPTPREPDATPRPSRDPGREPTPEPTRRPDRTAVPTPEPSRAPATADPTPKPTPKPGDATATPRPEPEPPRLRARKLLDRPLVAVTWTRTLGARSYVLLATGARRGSAPDPQYPGGDVRVLGEFSRPPETPLRFRVPDGVIEVKLLVVALRRDGTEIARSRIVTVATGP